MPEPQHPVTEEEKVLAQILIFAHNRLELPPSELIKFFKTATQKPQVERLLFSKESQSLPPIYERKKRGSLSEQDIESIRESYLDGVPRSQIAKLYNVSTQTIYNYTKVLA